MGGNAGGGCFPTKLFSFVSASSLDALDRKLDTLGDLVVDCVYELLHNCIHIRMYYATVSANDVVGRYKRDYLFVHFAF